MKRRSCNKEKYYQTHLENHAKQILKILMDNYEQFDYKLTIDFNSVTLERIETYGINGISIYWSGNKEDLFKTLFGAYKNLTEVLCY